MYKKWLITNAEGTKPLSHIDISTHFRPHELDVPWGIHVLPLDYKPMKEYLSKTKDIFEFEREGNCVVCEEELVPGRGIYATCPNEGCERVGHLTCWSRHMLKSHGSEQSSQKSKEMSEDVPIIPTAGECPSCKRDVQWGHMMKELTLRLRGQDIIEKLFRKRRGKAKENHCFQGEDEGAVLDSAEDANEQLHDSNV